MKWPQFILQILPILNLLSLAIPSSMHRINPRIPLIIILMKLHLNLAQIGIHLDTERPVSQQFISSRVAIKKGLDINVVQSCLDSLDVFRDLLEGIPQQKNRVVRDVCKNIQLKHYQQGDTVYDIDQKARAVYFCLSGQVSISIIKEVPKEPGTQSPEQRTQQNSYRNTEKLNTPKSALNLLSLASISVSTTSFSQQQQFQKIEQQIDVIETGQGFGQAEFISETTRTVKASIKTSQSLIGRLEIDHFTQVLQNYKQRVYYKKRDMFQKCALFADLPLPKLEFIINNTKPMTINISHQLVKEGAIVDTVYLINKGQVSLWKTGIQVGEGQGEDEEDDQADLVLAKSKSMTIEKKFDQKSIGDDKGQNNETLQSLNTIKSRQKLKHNKIFCNLLKIKQAKHPIPLEKHSKVFMGLLSEGSFIGDMELAMGCPFTVNAVCRTEKAEVYYCDRRIILSQMTEENIQQACKYYRDKETYINERIHKYKCAKEKIHRQKEIDLLPPLTKAQINIKRKLMHRHVEDKPSLIGHCSPRDIQKMISRKQKRVIKQPQMSKYPILQLFPNHSVKKRCTSPAAPSSFNPISIVESSSKRCITDYDQLDKESVVDESANPELKHSEEMKKFKSMLIQIKPTRIHLRDIKYGHHQENMAVVGKILGRYRMGDNKMKSKSQVIEKLQIGKK